MFKNLLFVFALLAGYTLSPATGNAFSPAAKTLSDSTAAEVLAAYRYFHQNPELGNNESKAHDYVRARLNRAGGFVFHTAQGAETAVIAVLETGRLGKTIALRAELDGRKLGMNIVEPLSNDPRSLVDGLMHNCGHDAHAAMLLGAALHIHANLDAFRGRFVFVFQPAEETKGGADDITNDGVLERLGVDAVFAQHVVPNLDVGFTTISPGTPLAGSNYFWLTLSGQSSHAAVPFEGSDLAVVASRMILDLTHFPARHVDIANRPMVISVARIESNGQSRNALPSEIKIGGTIRAFENLFASNGEQPPLSRAIEDRIQALAKFYRVSAKWELKAAAPPTKNDDLLYSAIIPELTKLWGAKLKTDLYRGMFSEDFSYYTQKVPSLYFGLGIRKDGLGGGAIHSAQFTIHPDALKVGTKLLTDIASIAP